MRKLKNYKPTKFKAKDSYYDKEYADFAVATIMALDRAIRCGNDTSESVYNNRGILFI